MFAKILTPMTEFSIKMVKCIADWSKKAVACNGNIECLDDCAKELRICLDSIFPYSKSIEFESDKVNYILSSIFFLASRLSKATVGLAEFDASISKIEQIGKASLESYENKKLYKKFESELNELLSKYF
jgi:hypothetical protein